MILYKLSILREAADEACSSARPDVDDSAARLHERREGGGAELHADDVRPEGPAGVEDPAGIVHEPEERRALQRCRDLCGGGGHGALAANLRIV